MPQGPPSASVNEAIEDSDPHCCIMDRALQSTYDEPLWLATTGKVLAYGVSLKKACQRCLQDSDDNALIVYQLMTKDRVVSPDSKHMPSEVTAIKIVSPSPKPGTLRFWIENSTAPPVEELLVLGPESMDTCRKVKWVKSRYEDNGFPEARSMVSCNTCHAFTTMLGALMQLWCQVADEWVCYHCAHIFECHCGHCHAPIYSDEDDPNIRPQDEGRYWCASCTVQYSCNFTGA